MIRISKTAAAAAVVAMGIAAPAFAQSFGAGPAAVVAASQDRVAVQKIRHRTVAARPSALYAYAAVPAFAGGTNLSPTATGGGSVGYNENLRRDDW